MVGTKDKWNHCKRGDGSGFTRKSLDVPLKDRQKIQPCSAAPTAAKDHRVVLERGVRGCIPSNDQALYSVHISLVNTAYDHPMRQSAMQW